MADTGPARPNLTIGIPTHNRSASIDRLLASLGGLPDDASVELLVVDDASTDATESVLDGWSGRLRGRLRVVRHSSRGGFGGSLATMIESARGRWILLASDDDVVLTQSLPDLLLQLHRVEPGILIPSFLDGTRGLIRAKATGTVVHPGKVWGSVGHAPGIVFDVERSRPHVGELRSLLESDDDFARVYPQVVIAINLVAAGHPLVHWSIATAATGEDNVSGIRDSKGEAYWSMSSRMRQYFAYQAYLRARIEQSSGPDATAFVAALEWNRVKLLDFFAAWLTIEHPAEAEAVARAMRSPRARRRRFGVIARSLRRS